jgi:hypothetical protein
MRDPLRHSPWCEPGSAERAEQLGRETKEKRK